MFRGRGMASVKLPSPGSENGQALSPRLGGGLHTHTQSCRRESMAMPHVYVKEKRKEEQAWQEDLVQAVTACFHSGGRLHVWRRKLSFYSGCKRQGRKRRITTTWAVS